MSHVLNYDGQYFRIDIAEVVKPDDEDKSDYVAWCSEAFNELKDLPKQSVSRFVAGPPRPTFTEALLHAHEWIKTHWDAEKTKRAPRTPKRTDSSSIIYTVWLFKDDGSVGFEFEEFVDAKAFAKAAEKSPSMTKIGITNNESPQYLTLWEKT